MNQLLKATIYVALYISIYLTGCGASDGDTVTESMQPSSGESVTMNGMSPTTQNPNNGSGDGTPITDTPGDTPAPQTGDQTPTEPVDTEPMPVPNPEDEVCSEGQERVDGACIPTDLDDVIDPAILQALVGTYAVQMKIAMIQEVPILGEMENVSTVYGFTEISEDGEGGVVMVERGCGARSSTGDAINVVIPSAIPRSVTPPVTPLNVWEENGIIHWSRPEVVVPIGIRLDDPVNDALPTDPNDPRIWDQDGDGAPGVTVNVMGFASGDLYIIQKQVSSEHGILNEAGEMEGFVVDNSLQVTIGGTNPLLNQQIPTRPNPDGSLSTLRSTKMAADRDCDWLLENQNQLFPENN